MKPIRVLLIDDHEEFLDTASSFLLKNSKGDIEIVGRASTGSEGIKLNDLLMPDVILLDVKLPDMNGLQIAKYLKFNNYPSHIIIITLFDTEEYRSEAAVSGAEGFVCKTNFFRDILPTIHNLYSEDKIYSSP